VTMTVNAYCGRVYDTNRNQLTVMLPYRRRILKTFIAHAQQRTFFRA